MQFIERVHVSQTPSTHLTHSGHPDLIRTFQVLWPGAVVQLHDRHFVGRALPLRKSENGQGGSDEAESPTLQDR